MENPIKKFDPYKKAKIDVEDLSVSDQNESLLTNDTISEIMVMVKTSKGNMFKLHVSLDDKVETIADLLAANNAQKCDILKTRLFHSGEYLEWELSFREQGVSGGCTLAHFGQIRWENFLS
jgi:hypothetical protein